MLTAMEYEALCNTTTGKERFEQHFDELAKISREISREINADDWRKGFLAAIEGEMKLTESGSHKIMYLTYFVRWLAANVEQFDTPDGGAFNFKL